MATVTTSEPGVTPPASRGAGAPVRTLALGLWGVVGSLLLYGIAMTAIKASALFG